MNKEDLLWTVKLILVTNTFTVTLLCAVFKLILIAKGN